MDRILTFEYMQRRDVAFGPRFGLMIVPQRRQLRLPGGRDLGDFLVSGRACDT